MKEKTSLAKLIKKEHVKIIFSFFGIITFISLLIPLVMLGFGIYFTVSKVNNYGVLWMVVGAVGFLFSLRRMKDIFPMIKYASNPESFPIYKALLDDGIDLSIYNEEIDEASPYEKLNKHNPYLVTENFIFGYSQVSFFILRKEDVMWIYEYNGNGLVLYDRHKIYGFTFFETVDGNDQAIEVIEKDLPYIYYGIDFDYKTIMHEEFDLTLSRLMEEREKFLADPDTYREEKAREKKEKEEAEARRIEEEARLLEEEKNNTLSEIEEAPVEETQEEVQEELKELDSLDEEKTESVLDKSVLDEFNKNE